MSKRTIESCRVCVVGGAGFLGSHMVDHLIQERNCRVLVLDNLSSGFKKFIHPKANFVHVDITGSETYLYKAFCHHQIEYVFNYAASPYIPDSFERPLHVFNINAFGALKVINAAQEAGCKGILQISSAEIYGGMGHFLSSEDAEKTLDKSIPRPLSEEEFVIPHSSYGASKAAIDSMVTARWKENRTPAIALRQFNCVGPRETHPYIVPEIISQISKFEYKEDMHGVYPVPIHLGNNSRRDFLFAKDQAGYACELLENGEFGEVYNLGSETSIRIYDLAETIGEIMGVNIEIIPDSSRRRPWEIWSLVSDNTKIHNVVSYRPKVDLVDALKQTVEYYELQNKWDWE